MTWQVWLALTIVSFSAGVVCFLLAELLPQAREYGTVRTLLINACVVLVFVGMGLGWVGGNAHWAAVDHANAVSLLHQTEHDEAVFYARHGVYGNAADLAGGDPTLLKQLDASHRVTISIATHGESALIVAVANQSSVSGLVRNQPR